MLRIGAVYEKDRLTLKESHLRLIGRAGVIYNPSLDIGQSLILEYRNKKLLGTCLRTSTITDLEQTDYGLWVTTRNTVYRLDNIVESEVDDTIGCFEDIVYARFLGKNGRTSDVEYAISDGLIIGNKYVVDNVIIHSWATDVYLDGRVKPYNSVMFEFTDANGNEFNIFIK